MNILYQRPDESILNAVGSRDGAKEIYRLINRLEEQSESIVEATMAKAAARGGKSNFYSGYDIGILQEQEYRRNEIFVTANKKE